MVVLSPAARAGDQPQHRRLAALDQLQPAPHQRAGSAVEASIVEKTLGPPDDDSNSTSY